MSANPQDIPGQFPIAVDPGFDPRFPAHSGIPGGKLNPASVGPPLRVASPQVAKVGLSEICLSYRTQSGERLLARRQSKDGLATAAARCAVPHVACLEQGHLIAPLRQVQSGRASGDAAAEHHHVGAKLTAQRFTMALA